MIPTTGGKAACMKCCATSTCFLPNEREACKAAGTDDLEAAVHELSKLVPLVVVKLGPKEHWLSAAQSVSPAPRKKSSP